MYRWLETEDGGFVNIDHVIGLRPVFRGSTGDAGPWRIVIVTSAQSVANGGIGWSPYTPGVHETLEEAHAAICDLLRRIQGYSYTEAG